MRRLFPLPLASLVAPSAFASRTPDPRLGIVTAEDVAQEATHDIQGILHR